MEPSWPTVVSLLASIPLGIYATGRGRREFSEGFRVPIGIAFLALAVSEIVGSRVLETGSAVAFLLLVALAAFTAGRRQSEQRKKGAPASKPDDWLKS